jgi:hypothetical protein
MRVQPLPLMRSTPLALVSNIPLHYHARSIDLAEAINGGRKALPYLSLRCSHPLADPACALRGAACTQAALAFKLEVGSVQPSVRIQLERAFRLSPAAMLQLPRHHHRSPTATGSVHHDSTGG